MSKKILIVEDQFIEANDLQLMLLRAGYQVCGIARSAAIAREMIRKEKPDLVLLDIFLKGKETGIDLAKELANQNIAFVYLSANSNEEILNAAKATQPYGFLVKPFREKDILIMLEIARYRHAHSTEFTLRKENILHDKLTAIANSTDAREKKLLTLCKTLQPYISFDYITAEFNSIVDSPDHAVSFLRIGFDEYQQIGVPELLTITGWTMKDLLQIVNDGALYKFLSDTFQMKSCTSFPLYLSNGGLFTFSVYSRHADTYNSDRTGLFTQMQKVSADLIATIFTEKAIKTISPPVQRAATKMSGSTQPGFDGIIGNSHLLLNVFDNITQVAPFDTAVLILGESGTGKERIAECIHNLSPYKGKPLVKVNCAALPATLIESELFGHEKGSFTGATDKRIGKFEQANGGTIFLDEIGEMPVDLQVKLLRVLQAKEIEPIGSKSSLKINVRVIAATNRNLEKEVAEGRFRLDLYYRLNVFPIALPSLRERAEDIPVLANHFIRYYNQKAGKKISGLSNKVLQEMAAYHWPGNIRELENLIERSVLLAKGTMIEEMTLPNSRKIQEEPDMHLKTIYENERDHIISILKKCNGRIWGAGGAAEVLNVPPTTLKSKMKKLGIEKDNTE